MPLHIAVVVAAAAVGGLLFASELCYPGPGT